MKREPLYERYINALETALTVERQRVDFYRAKVERLEMAIMSRSAVPEQQAYAARSDAPPPITETKMEMPRHVPWRELQRRWGSMSAAEQELAVAEGWNADNKEENDEGK